MQLMMYRDVESRDVPPDSTMLIAIGRMAVEVAMARLDDAGATWTVSVTA